MMAQSLARDLGPKGVHVGLFIIDGQVGTPGGGDPTKLDPNAIANANAFGSCSVKFCAVPLASLKIIFSAGNVQKMVRVPDDQLTALSELLDCKIVVRAKVVPDAV